MERTALWLRSVCRLTLLYLVAGLLFAPWGVVYASLRTYHVQTHPLVTLVLLGCGLLTALVAWRRVERWMPEHRHPSSIAVRPRISVIRLEARVDTEVDEFAGEPNLILLDIRMPADPSMSTAVARMEKFEPVARTASGRVPVFAMVK